MKVQLFLAADYANMSLEGKLNVMGIFRSIHASSFPARHSSMVVVLKFIAELGEVEETRDITVKLLDQDGREHLTVKGQALIPKYHGPNTPDVDAILELRDIVFPTPGDYVFVVLVDKDNKAELPIQVNQITPNHAGSDS